MPPNINHVHNSTNTYISSQCDLAQLDPDLHIPVQSNFQYYSTDYFRNNEQISNCTKSVNFFSALHSNIRSMAANFDSLIQMTSELDHNFSIIGLTETKFKV